MKKLLFLLPGMVISILPLLSQSSVSEPSFGIKFSGFVRSDIFFDTRQTVAAREGVFMLWPQKAQYDVNGEDINAKSNFNMLAILSRVSGAISGPDAFGAKTSGMIEFDFFGQANDNISLVRLRLGFIKLTWNKTDLLIGQYWNPLFVTDNIPSTTNINSGVPFNSFGRSPQVRLTMKAGDLSLIAAAVSQRDFTSYASTGTAAATASSNYLRNAVLPDLHLQAHYNIKADNGISLLTGAGMAYKTIVPRLFVQTILGQFSVDESISGLSAMAFARLTTKPVTLKLYARYGENLTDMLAPGGYGIIGPVVPLGYDQLYAPVRIKSFWADLQTNGARFQTGIFAGYLVNSGTKEELITNMAYGNATDIAGMMRVAPRVNFISGKTKFSFETEYTTAAFGDGSYDNHGVPQNEIAVGNVRLIFTSIYSF